MNKQKLDPPSDGLCNALAAERGTTVVLASHALEWVAVFADRVIVLENGGILADGAPADVLTAPALEVSGVGDLWFTSYGGIEVVDITQPFMIDNGHIVGYEGQLNMSVKRPGGGMMGLIASGEGLVCEFTGQGRVYLQSRNLSSLVSWLSPLLP